MKTPAFQFYPGDFLSSPDVQMMTTLEVGAYCLLLFNSWIITERPGYLPNNENKLKRLAKLSDKDWNRIKEVVLEKFSISEDGKYLYNKRLIAEYNKQEERRLRLAENGRKGGRPPKQEDSLEKPTDNLQVNSEKPNDKQEERLSISSSISSSISPSEKNITPPKPPKPPTLHQSAIAAFISDYRDRFATEYLFDGGKDGKAISKILGYIKKKIAEKNQEVTDERVLSGFNYFLKSITDKWIIDNYSPSMLASKFNDLFVKSIAPRPSSIPDNAIKSGEYAGMVM